MIVFISCAARRARAPRTSRVCPSLCAFVCERGLKTCLSVSLANSLFGILSVAPGSADVATNAS